MQHTMQAPFLVTRQIVQETSVIDFALNPFIGLDHGEKMDLEGLLHLYVRKCLLVYSWWVSASLVKSYPGSKRTLISYPICSRHS